MAEAPRKLAAIVSVDIAGFSALAERDQAEALAHVARVRATAMDLAARHGGRIFNTAGDGVMLEFASVTNALNAAIALCEAETKAKLRFGVHLGEVTEAANGDLLGHGVNIAARLQAEAAPGAILVSEIVRDNAAPELAARLQARGKIKLAKMRALVSVFALDPSGAAVKAHVGAPTLAVLPFDTPARDRATRTLADGVSEEILYSVSRVPGVKVIGATSSFAFRGRDKPRAAKALNATHLLDGSVRRMDDRVRIAAHLTEAETGVVLWSERYDRDLADAFALQEEIAGEVVKALSVTLGEAKRVRAPKLTAALSDTYFEARELMRTGAIACIQAAAAALERVVREAPDFARAWAALASAKLEVLRLSRADRAGLVDDAREAAERALGADPSMGEAYAVLAALEGEFFGRWREREALIEKALSVEPNNPHLLFRHGQFLIATGRVAAGFAEQARAFELDPLDPMLAAFHGYNLWSQGQKGDGRAILEDAAQRYGDNVFVWFMRLNTAALDGDFATAQALRADAARLLPTLVDSASYKAGERMQQLMMAPSPEAFMQLGQDFSAMAEAEPASALDLAVALSVLGFTGPALEIFGDALDNPDAWRAGALETTRPHIGYETALLFINETRMLRNDPAFAKLCVRLGLARYWRETERWPDCAGETAYDFRAACEG
ncbi:MAG TPA: adenylate/guanylate cyclase domain-containing protein [Vitreimonas sp.]|uniref:adenylate/guanylate cyclase domain-containing protein n=1 Tax=Vitreimonas sp. TaxID=3069702 RepID=UPI002D2DA5B5|nr:adenylate/guanylate cyclase domain-containing protein [Vitreimonas sp.]HYD87595.1 adenylate/guanylate cyclase domain-containing protein [Vitreimonas sp.]